MNKYIMEPTRLALIKGNPTTRSCTENSNPKPMKCMICGKDLIYDFEITDGICEDCMIKFKEGISPDS